MVHWEEGKHLPCRELWRQKMKRKREKLYWGSLELGSDLTNLKSLHVEAYMERRIQFDHAHLYSD